MFTSTLMMTSMLTMMAILPIHHHQHAANPVPGSYTRLSRAMDPVPARGCSGLTRPVCAVHQSRGELYDARSVRYAAIRPNLVC